MPCKGRSSLWGCAAAGMKEVLLCGMTMVASAVSCMAGHALAVGHALLMHVHATPGPAAIPLMPSHPPRRPAAGARAQLAFAPAVPPPCTHKHPVHMVAELQSVTRTLHISPLHKYHCWTFNGTVGRGRGEAVGWWCWWDVGGPVLSESCMQTVSHRCANVRR